MTVSIVGPKLRTDMIPGFRFAIVMGTWIRGWFTECSGLAVEREVKEQQEGGLNDYVHQLPGRIKQNRITLKHGLAGNELWSWLQTGLYDGQVDRRHISIVIYGISGTPYKWWDVSDAYPIKWSGPTLNTASNETTLETLELVHHGLKMRDLSLATDALSLI